MSPRPPLLPPPGVLVLTLTSMCGCGPPLGEVPRDLQAEALRYAEAACAARELCGCDDGRFASRDACELDLVEDFMTQVDRGLSFNAECFDDLIASEALTCAEWPWSSYVYMGCTTLQGSAHEGETCTWHRDLLPLHANDCADGLVCDVGVCAQGYGHQNRDVGEPCKQGPVPNCASGLWCGADDICHPWASAGGPCVDFFDCEYGMYCAGLGTSGEGACAVQLELEQSCDPKDWNACSPGQVNPTWTWCAPSSSGYACEVGHPGICYLTFPVFP